MDLECFVHGALCICQWGQCLFSSLVGGRSANRGLVRAAVPPAVFPRGQRRQEARRCGPVPAEPAATCAASRSLPQLIDAGVASLKIEGRMKWPNFVNHARARPARRSTARGRIQHRIGQPSTRSASLQRGVQQGLYHGVSHRRARQCHDGLQAPQQPRRRGRTRRRLWQRLGPRQRDRGAARGRPARGLEQRRARHVHGRHIRFASRPARPSSPIHSARSSPGGPHLRVRSARLAADADARTEQGLAIPVALDVRVVVGEPLRISVSDETGHSSSVEGAVVEPRAPRQ